MKMRRMLARWALVVLIGGCGASEEAGADLATTTSEITGCVPGPWQAAIFQGYSRTGSCQNLSLGVYRAAANTGLPDNSIKSVLLGANVRVVVFADPNYTGPGQILYTSGDVLSSIAVSSLRVERKADRCEEVQLGTWFPPAGAISVFRSDNYKGDCETLHYDQDDCSSQALAYPGMFPVAEDCIGSTNDSMSSAVIGPRTSAHFYRQWYFNVYQTDVEESMINTLTTVQFQPHFSNNTIGNDTVSSLKVFYNP